MNYNTKQFWEKVKQDFQYRPIDYLCLSSETFQTEWLKSESEIIQLAIEFLKNSEWNKFIEVKVCESQHVLFYHKNSESWKENWRINVRMDFINWNINRLTI